MMRSAANFDSPVAETGDELSPDDDFIALSDETLIGWIKFGAEGELPERHQGLLYQGFVMPPRESLGDTDEGPWPEGLSGQPADPWQHQVCLVLQSPVTQELFTFSTTSQTGRCAGKPQSAGGDVGQRRQGC